MATNLLDRNPVPGSLGVAVASSVYMHLATTGTILSPSITIKINGVNAILAGVFVTGYSGTLVSDGSGGWIITIVPALPFLYKSIVSVQVIAADPAPFNQTYTFTTVRNIQVSVIAEYVEIGDTVNATIYPFEDTKKVPATVTFVNCTLYAASVVPSAAKTLIDSYSFVNENNSASADGVFNLRFLHPLAVRRDMTFEAVLTFDPYQAPGVAPITVAGNVTFIQKTNAVLIDGHTQPNVQGERSLPRTEYEGRNNRSFQIEGADYQSVDLSGERLVPDILVDLRFMAKDSYIAVLEGDVTYVGGGHRLLRGIEDSANYVLQDAVDEFAHPLGGRLLSEFASTNSFPNSAFLDIDNPFVLSATDTKVITEGDVFPFIVSDADNLTQLVNQAHFVFEGLSFYDGNPRHAYATSPTIGYTTGNNVLISFLVRILYRDSTVTLTDFKVSAQFFNSSDVLVYSTPVVYDPGDFVSENLYSLVELPVTAGVIPPTATKVNFLIDIDSFESCDRIEVFMVGPSIEFNPTALFATSRVVSDAVTTTRLADGISIGQANNFNIERGMVVVEYTPLYDGAPPNNATFFDTRLPGSLLNGFVAFHRADGVLEFRVVDPAGVTQTVVSTTPLNFPIGSPVTVSFIWDSSVLSIKVGQDVVGTFSGAYLLPNGINTTLSVGRNSNNQDYLLSEILRFLVYSRPIN